MRLLQSWLSDFIDIDLTPDELAGKFTLLGIEVEAMEKTGACFTGVRVAEILKIDKHPNADKLSLVLVNTGAGEQTVVCGAKNIAVGQKIPLAGVGAKLPDGELKKTSIRGVESCGMICSAGELQVAESGPAHEHGIMVLDAGLAPGADVAALFGEPDCVFELKITPNRPELLSVLGIARELAVQLDKPLKKPAAPKIEGTVPPIPVRLEDPESCPRYTARVLKNLENRASPDWMQKRLKALDSNPKNALVDITNYVLYETGHPLHAFDFDKLAGGELAVRRARPGERLNTLDGRDVPLDPGCLVIADAEKPAALAGIMGGTETAVSEETHNIVLESAYFHPPVIHITARKYGFRSESSYRFERSTDIENAVYASDRATELILACCSTPETVVSELGDSYPKPYAGAEVGVTPRMINDILGTEIADEEILRILRALSPDMDTSVTPWIFKAPSHRRDISLPCDLAEEVAMYAGYDRIPVAPRPATVTITEIPAQQRLASRYKDKLAALGFYEVYNYDFLSGAELAGFGLEPGQQPELENPLSLDWQYLRPSLLPGIARAAAYNARHSAQAANLFETGKVYAKTPGRPAEKLHLAALLCGTWPQGAFWRGGEIKPLDFFHVKGIVSSLLSGFEQVDFSPDASPPDYMHPGICAGIKVNGKPAGRAGRLHPSSLRAAGLKTGSAWSFELDLDTLAKCGAASVKVKPVAEFPSAWRDISVVIDKTAPYSRIEKTVRDAAGEHLQSVTLHDVYNGENIPAGSQSVTLRLVYFSPERTLRDSEVETSFNAVIAALGSKLNARLRS
ncbi:MAG: phenylalanine--tRNA ligase subunit beta [Elusimicrobiaceae bacterium]|nr:phenylalanine--tRNA ligase subunit beta [Elusimicrobiaceae bacterium]